MDAIEMVFQSKEARQVYIKRSLKEMDEHIKAYVKNYQRRCEQGEKMCFIDYIRDITEKVPYAYDIPTITAKQQTELAISIQDYM